MNLLELQIWTYSGLLWTSRYQNLQLQKTRWVLGWSPNGCLIVRIQSIEAAGATSVTDQPEAKLMNYNSLTLYHLSVKFPSKEMETDKSEETEKKKRKLLCFTVKSVKEKKERTHTIAEVKSWFLLPSAPKCGFIKGNEKIMMLLEKVKPEIVAFRETIITVSGCSGYQNVNGFGPLWPPSVTAGFLLDSAPHP